MKRLTLKGSVHGSWLSCGRTAHRALAIVAIVAVVIGSTPNQVVAAAIHMTIERESDTDAIVIIDGTTNGTTGTFTSGSASGQRTGRFFMANVFGATGTDGAVINIGGTNTIVTSRGYTVVPSSAGYTTAAVISAYNPEPDARIIFTGNNVGGDTITGSIELELTGGWTWAATGGTGNLYCGNGNNGALLNQTGTWTMVAGTPPFTYWVGAAPTPTCRRRPTG